MGMRPLIHRFVLAAAALRPAGEAATADVRGPVVSGPNVHVSAALAKDAHAEVILAADPAKPGRLLAGSQNEGRGGDSPTSVVAYSSSDGGRTWGLALQLERKAADGGRNSGYYDPTVAFGPDGAAYIGALRMDSNLAGSAKIQIEVVTSPDGDKSWGAPVAVGVGDRADRPFLAADCTGRKFRGRLYCHCKLPPDTPRADYAPAVYISRDGGRTFGPPNRLPVKRRGAGQPGPCAVLSDGTLVVPYTVYPVSLPPAGDRSQSLAIHVRRSAPGGESFADDQPVQVRDYLGRNSNTWLVPVLAADPGSKAFAGHLYLAWAEKAPGGVQVMLTLSEDKGATWSKPVRLSEQPESRRSQGKGHHAFQPAVAVSNAGVVGVSWYDTRDGRDGKPACHVRFRASLDGGATWLSSVRVTDAASSFELSDKNGGVDPKDWLGNTAGLAADSDGVFHPLWIDNRTGVKQVFTARVTVESGPP